MQPVDWIVLVLAVAVMTILVNAAIGTWFRPLTDDAGQRLAGLIGSLIAIISLYVGARLRFKNGGNGK